MPFFRQDSRRLHIAAAAGRLAAVIALLLLPACAASSSGTKPVIKIGLAAPFEGLGRPLGYDSLNGAKLAIAECNANGGVAGYMVELVALDHGDDPRQAQAQAAELAADHDVLAAIAGWSQPTAAAEIPIYRELGLPVVIAWTVSPDLAAADDGIVSIAADSATTALQLAKEVAVDTEVLVIAEDQTAFPYRQVLANGHFFPPPTSWTQANADAWAEDLLANFDPPPQSLLLATTGARAGQVLDTLWRAGWQGQVFVSPDAGSPLLPDIAKESANGVLTASPAPAGMDLPLTGELATDAAGLGTRGVMAYDATQLLLLAIESAARETGKPNRQSVMARLPQVRSRGLTGEIFLRDGVRQSPPIWLYQLEAGQYPGRLLKEIRP